MADDYIEQIKKMAAQVDDPSKRIRVAILAHRVDRDAGNELVDELRSYGVLVWTEERIYPGQDLELETYRAYTEADFILILVSSRSVKLENVYQKNIRVALKVDEKPEDGILIIPIRLDECRLPLILQEKFAVDWWEERSRQRLVAGWAKEWDRRNEADDWHYKNYLASWE